MTGPTLLAQSSMNLEQGMDIFKSLGWLLAGVAVLIVVAFFVRRWLLSDIGKDSSQFTMKQLREMRDQGLLNQGEFDRAKGSLVARGRSILHEEEPLTNQDKPSGATSSPEQDDHQKESPGDEPHDR